MDEYAPGDVVEVKTPKGLSYVQVTHSHPSYPPVVRFLSGPYKSRPDNMTVFTGGGQGKRAMIPLKGVLEKLKLEHSKVATTDIPPADRNFPTFRMPIRDKQGEIIYWWFWDGQGLSYSSELTEAQKNMPLREVMSSESFLEQLVADAD